MRKFLQPLFLALFLVCSPIINVYPQDDLAIIKQLESDIQVPKFTRLLKASEAEFEMSCTYRLEVADYEHWQFHTGTAVAVDLADCNFEKFNPKKAKRYLLTAAHVVCDKTHGTYPELTLDLSKSFARCHVVKIDKCLDIAIIECKEDLPVQAKLDDTPITAGLHLVNVGCPHGDEPRAAAGLSIMQFAENENKWYASATGYTRGCSGGPFFHDKKIAGIAIEGMLDPKDAEGNQKMHEGLGIFVLISKIKDFIAAK